MSCLAELLFGDFSSYKAYACPYGMSNRGLFSRKKLHLSVIFSSNGEVVHRVRPSVLERTVKTRI